MPSAADGAERPPHWASLREAGLSAGLWFLYGVNKWGGRWLFRVLLWPVAVYFTATRGIARRASAEYLERVGVLPAGASLLSRWWHVTRHIERFADALLDKALAWTGALDLATTPVSIDPHLEAALDAGRGGLLVVAHCGNLEVLRTLARRMPKVRLRILVHTRHAQRFNRLLTRLNPDSAANLLQVTDIDAAAAAELSHWVGRGEFVVIAADRVPVSGQPGHTRDIPFLGPPRAAAGGSVGARSGARLPRVLAVVLEDQRRLRGPVRTPVRPDRHAARAARRGTPPRDDRLCATARIGLPRRAVCVVQFLPVLGAGLRWC